MLKANMAAVDALTAPGFPVQISIWRIDRLGASPPTGLLQPFHNWMRLNSGGFGNPVRFETQPLLMIVTKT
jgi:hypothetical protein